MEQKCIDEMIIKWGEENVKLWCEMTAYTYEYRMGDRYNKVSEDDWKKRKWYLDKAFEFEYKKEQEKERFATILNYYGEEAQKRQLIEEMAELTQALNKEWRYKKGFIKADFDSIRNNIIEELADTIVCIEQMILLFGRDKIDGFLNGKLERALKRIEESPRNATND